MYKVCKKKYVDVCRSKKIYLKDNTLYCFQHALEPAYIYHYREVDARQGDGYPCYDCGKIKSLYKHTTTAYTYCHMCMIEREGFVDINKGKRGKKNGK